ncbi:MAG: hypothetical protein IKT55_00670 [Clostridia bacterium]|nr:hypothetical protein [Clostridia bacterium]
MKKYFALVLTLVMLLSLGACGEKKYVDDPHALETADTYYGVENNAGSITLTPDSAKVMLGVYSAKQLGLKKTIDQYDLVLSATTYEGKDGCKIEAFAKDEKTAEGTFLIIGTQCYVYNAKTEKYTALSSSATKPVADKTTSPANTIPDDPDIEFQYHKENNYLMQQRFSAYEYATLGLEKEIEQYVFVVNGNSGVAIDGVTVYYVDVYEKNGEKTDVRLGFSADGDDYIYNVEYKVYEKIEA